MKRINNKLNKKIAIMLTFTVLCIIVPVNLFAEDREIEYEGYIVGIEENANINLEDTELNEVVKNEIYQADSISEIKSEIPACDIEYIEPNYIVKPCDTFIPNDAKYSNMRWAHDIMNIQKVWERGYFGNYISTSEAPTVAIIDSGIVGTGINPKNSKHEDLNYDNILSGKNLMGKNPNEDTDDDSFHGSFISGIISAKINNGIGIAGDMPNIKLRPYKQYDFTGIGSAHKEAKCIYAAIDDGVDVINLSCSMLTDSETEKNAINEAVKHGIIVCASAGNEGNRNYSYPASRDGVISVGSINSIEEKSSFSQYNDMVDVVAPGEGILSIDNSGPNGYRISSGTSFSCPQVVALAALCKSIDPTIEHDRFMELLKSTSRDAGPAGYDTSYGWGIIDYGNMLDALVPEDNSIWAADISGISGNADYTGSAITFDNLKITMPDGIELSVNSDYTVTYYNNVKVGIGMIAVQGIGNYTGRINKYFNIRKEGEPGEKHGGNTSGRDSTDKIVGGGATLDDNNEESSNAEPVKPDPIKVIAPTIKKLAAGKKFFTITWKKQSADGYQLQYSTSKTFKKSVRKTITISKNKTSCTIKKLKAKKKYYVRMRGYKVVDGRRTNSAWTNIAKIKTR